MRGKLSLSAVFCAVSASLALAARIDWNTDSFLVRGCAESVGITSNIGATCPMWEATNMGWNYDPNYDDSDWDHAVRNEGDQYLFTWAPEDVPTVYYRYKFVIPGIPTASRFEVWADDDVLMWLNGKTAWVDANKKPTYKLFQGDLTPLLKPGLNLVTAKAQDMGYLWKHLTIAGGITYTHGIGPGDLNGDYVVNSLDLDIVRAHWGAEVGAGWLSHGDATGDGLVNSADLDAVRGNWSSWAAVPEPSIAILVAVGMSALAWRRFRRCV